jgi:hypothetical protein
MNNFLYGYSPDKPDDRDHLFAEKVSSPVALPTKVSLRDKMPPVFDQGSLGSCHDSETQVLTENGWKLFADILEGEKLATVDPRTGNLEFEQPLRLIRFDYVGEMICASNQSLDFKVTPDHKMLVRKWDERARTLSSEYEFVAAKDLGWYCGLLSRVKRVTEQADIFVIPGVDHKHIPQRSDREMSMSSWVKFLGIYLAEGTLIKPWNGQKTYAIQLAAVKEREKTFIRDLLNEMQINFLELDDRIMINNRQIYECLSNMGLLGVKAPQKFVPDFIFHQSSEIIKDFLLGHFMGDGCEYNGSISHYTSSKQLADDLQRLIFMSGSEAGLFVREARSSMMADGRAIVGVYPEHRVSARSRKNLSIERKKNIFKEYYVGEVFCAEVPSFHTLVTRRNGKILVSGNCTSNALASAVAFEHGGGPYSRLFIYYRERMLEGNVGTDSGAQLRDGIKAIAQKGVCLENTWPYDISKFTQTPPSHAYGEATKAIIKSYSRLLTRDDYRRCLAQGYPFVCGFEVYQSFESATTANTGIAFMPQPNEQILGGHAVTVIGYDSDFHNNPVFLNSGLPASGVAEDMYEVQNSWGPNFGDAGRFWIPAAYFENPNLCGDSWTIRK